MSNEHTSDWDYRLPERFQESGETAETAPETQPENSWDYRLPERYRD